MFPKVQKPKKAIYLDYAAATPLDPQVKKVMEPFWFGKFGNPSSLYQKGSEAKQAVQESRKMIATLINAKSEEIIFTAGGSESVNLAIFGAARINTSHRTNKHKPLHIITSAIEHHCVINSVRVLAEEGSRVTFVTADRQGFISFETLQKSARPETVLISVMLANNEIGTIQPIAQIGRWLKQINVDRLQKGLKQILFHTDACQAAGFLNLNVESLGVDLMSVNGSKIYGPKQTGFLYVRNGIKIKPLIYGGGQERGLRGGTENVPGIVGLAKAFELAQNGMAKENIRLYKLQQYLNRKILKEVPNILLNGFDNQKLKVNKLNKLLFNRLPNNLNFTFKGVEGEALMLYLDAYGISCSTSSACSTGLADPSHVLLAIGRNKEEAKSSIRFSLGKYTKKSDLDYLIKILPGIVLELRR